MFKLFAVAAQHPAKVLGVFFALLCGFLFADSALFGDDTLFLERFIPTMQSWSETWELPPRLREWFGAMHRPLSLASWRFDNLIFGTNWAGHHWHQALWYGASISAFVAMCSQVLMLLGPELRQARRLQALWAIGLLFAIHPIHIETAAWIATRHDVIFATCLCAAIAAGARALGESSFQKVLLWAVLSAVLGGLGVQAKESAYVWLPLLCLLVLQVHWRGDLRSWKKAGLTLLPSLLVFVLCISFRQQSGIDGMRQWHPDAFSRWLSACGWAMDYTILPMAPRLFYDQQPPAASGLLAISVAAVWFAVGWKRRRHDGLSLFGLGFAAATLAPTWMVAWQPLMETIVADRYLFLPVGGILLALARLLSVRKLAVRMVILSAMLIWSALATPYLLAWSGPPCALSEYVVAQAPNNMECRIGAVSRCLRANDIDGAKNIAAILPAPRLRADRPSQADSLLMLIAMAEEDWPAASRAAQAVVLLNPENPSRWHDLGALQWQNFLAQAKRSPSKQAPTELLIKAKNSLERALALDVRNFRAHLLMGKIQASLKEFEIAQSHFEKCLHWGGNSAEARAAKNLLNKL